jgi:hypothetical protein
MSKINRNEHLAIMLENDLEDSKSFLERIVRCMSDDEYYSYIEYLEQVEYWRYRVNKQTGEVIDTRPEEDKQ